MLNTPFSPWPSFTQAEADAVSQVTLSNKVHYWTGQECRLFEAELAAWCGTPHAIALTNGTGAILRQGKPNKPLLIGRGAIVGMGAVVTRDVPPGVTVVGNPARPLIKD